MLLAEFKAPISYGLLIIAAPESRDPHDGWDPATSGTVHAGADSLYVGVADPTTGLVSVACHEGAGFETHLGRLFAGEMQLPSARLEFSDPEEAIKISVPVSSERVSVVVYADETSAPRELVVEVAPLG